MSSSPTALYRSILRELRKSAVSPPAQRSKAITSHLRQLFTTSDRSAEERKRDAENALTFLRSQRTYKELLVRYNPLHDLTSEEHLKATANRVGLNMPIEVN